MDRYNALLRLYDPIGFNCELWATTAHIIGIIPMRVMTWKMVMLWQVKLVMFVAAKQYAGHYYELQNVTKLKGELRHMDSICTPGGSRQTFHNIFNLLLLNSFSFQLQSLQNRKITLALGRKRSYCCVATKKNACLVSIINRTVLLCLTEFWPNQMD